MCHLSILLLEISRNLYTSNNTAFLVFILNLLDKINNVSGVAKCRISFSALKLSFKTLPEKIVQH